MKKVLFLLALTLMGCKTSYVQVYETKSKKNISIEDNKYVFENDTLKITYNFWKNKGLMYFTIYNKLEIPIYIDWKKSSYIDNSVKLNYWENEESTIMSYASYYYTGYYGNYGKYGTSKWASRIIKTKEERVTFIPPKSIYRRAQYYILPQSVISLYKNSAYKEVFQNGSTNKKIKLYEKEFNKENTPLIFRNFLTSSLTEDFESEFYIDNEFYISKVLEMDVKHFYGRANANRYSRIEEDANESIYKDDRHFYIDLGEVSMPKKKIKVEINKK